MSQQEEVPVEVVSEEHQKTQVTTDGWRERGLVERRLNTLQKRVDGVLTHDSSDPEDHVGEDHVGEEVGGKEEAGKSAGDVTSNSAPLLPDLIDIDTEMDNAAPALLPTLPSPPKSLSLREESESEPDLVTVTPYEKVLEPSNLELESPPPCYDPEVMRALDEMAAPAEDYGADSEWNLDHDVRFQILWLIVTYSHAWTGFLEA